MHDEPSIVAVRKVYFENERSDDRTYELDE